MGKYTLDTDYSKLNSPEAEKWLKEFSDNVELWFNGKDNDAKILGNLLIFEAFINTVKEGLKATDDEITDVISVAMDYLWDYLKNKTYSKDLENFAANLYAGVLAYNIGSDLTEEQEEFYEAHLNDDDRERGVNEWSVISWIADLLLEVVAQEGGHLDVENFDAFENIDTISFFNLEEMLDGISDVCIEIENVPCEDHRAVNVIKAMEEAHTTNTYKNIVRLVQKALIDASSAEPKQYGELRNEFSQYTIVPKEFAEDFVSF